MSKKIMIVDDSGTIRQQVAAALTGAGFAMAEAIDGEDGLAKLTAAQDVALVICDVNMPKLNGLDMLEKLRKVPRLETLPVIMLTTEGQPEHIARAKSLGAKGWLVKPFRPDLLIAAVKKLTA